MLAGMTSVTCPRCYSTFETAAVTNTRCRNCRHVVNIGRRRGGTSRSAHGTSAPRADEASSAASAMLIGLGLVGAGAIGLWRGWHLPRSDGLDQEKDRGDRRRWIALSAVALVMGVIVVAAASRRDED